MDDFPPTLIIRHRKENLKKCSLRGLEKRRDFLFFRYPLPTLPPFENYLLLSLDADKPLSQADCTSGLILLDATWTLAAHMSRNITFPHTLQKRRLPSLLLTAYPRYQNGCSDPSAGLASIEAIFAAYTILHRPTAALLDNYYWKDSFLEKNSSFLLNYYYETSWQSNHTTG